MEQSTYRRWRRRGLCPDVERMLRAVDAEIADLWAAYRWRMHYTDWPVRDQRVALSKLFAVRRAGMGR